MSKLFIKIRQWLFRLKMINAGVTFQLPCFVVGKMPRLDCSGSLELGKSVCFRGVRVGSNITVGNKGSLVLSDGVFINNGVNICCAHRIKVGDHTKIADEVIIYDTNFHPTSEGEPVEQNSVNIGRNVWIGARAIILPGSNIGAHAVIAAGAVVNGDIPPRSIAGGVPAKVLGSFVCNDSWIRP